MTSVVLAAYNGSRYIEAQLDSIKNQTAPPDEVIISDDCSTDNTREIVRNYIASHGLSCWKLIENTENKGFFSNFLDAVGMAAGDTVYLSDQDDIWCADKLRTFEALFASDSSITMLQSDIAFIDAEGHTLPQKEPYHYKPRHSAEAVELTVEDMCRFAGSGFTMAFRHGVYDALHAAGFDKMNDVFTYHDILLGLSAAAMGRVLLIPSVVDLHRLHTENATERSDRSWLSDRTRAVQLKLLENRSTYLSLISSLSSFPEKKALFMKAAEFADIRHSLVSRFSLGKLKAVISRSAFYASKKGIVTDSLYGLGLEKLLLSVFRKL